MLDLSALDGITPGSSITDLDKPQLTAVQRGLAISAYLIGAVDGLFGPNTKNAFAKMVADHGNGNPEIITQEGIAFFKSRQADLKTVFAMPSSTTQEVKDQIAAMFKYIGLSLPTQIAYGLATTEWETAHTFKPVCEAYWETEAWRKANLRYYPYFGRGYVQLTWEKNYKLYGGILGLDLVGDPNLAMGPDVALFVLGQGMREGEFTGRSLGEYVNKDKTDFLNARRVINGTNKASEIAALAEGYLKELQ